MGLLANMRSSVRQAESAVVIQKLLEAQQRSGLGVAAPAAAVASKLVQTLCERNPGLVAGVLPSKFALAASALVSGVNAMKLAADRQHELAFASCLGLLMTDIYAREGQLKLVPLDLALLSAAEETLANY